MSSSTTAAAVLLGVLVAMGAGGAGGHGGGVARPVAAPVHVSGIKAYAKQKMAGHGWGSSQWPCLHKLWDNESDWDPHADNPDTSAYGIPQGMRMHFTSASRARYVREPRFQVRWGLGYIDRRYGSPCAALTFWNNPTTGPAWWGNWY